MFKNALEELIKTKKINSGLQDYKSAQSQYFTLASEIGIFGIFIILYLAASSLLKMKKVITNKENKSTLLLKSIYLTAPVISILIIDMDILSFRWFWGFLAICLIMYKYSKS